MSYEEELRRRQEEEGRRLQAAEQERQRAEREKREQERRDNHYKATEAELDRRQAAEEKSRKEHSDFMNEQVEKSRQSNSSGSGCLIMLIPFLGGIVFAVCKISF